LVERAKDPKPLERRDPMPSGGVDAVLPLGRSGHQGAAGEGMESLAEVVWATGRYSPNPCVFRVYTPSVLG
jgi:hypothetical protein